MKLKLFFFALLIMTGLSSCLKTYTCECDTTDYSNYAVTKVESKVVNHFNGSRKPLVRSECMRYQDSSINNGTGWVRRCDITD